MSQKLFFCSFCNETRNVESRSWRRLPWVMPAREHEAYMGFRLVCVMGAS